MPPRASALRKYTAKPKRRRTSVATKAKYQKPSAANQKRQILGNAYAIRAMRKMLPNPAYCDWQRKFDHVSLTSQDGFTNTINSTELMSPVTWISVLRKDDNVNEASTTCVKRLQLNLRYLLQQSRYTQQSVFVVSLRRNAANRIPGSFNLVLNDDYIYSGLDWNVRLNPSIFRVHWCRYVTMTSSGLLDPRTSVTPGQTFAGNPNTTFAKGQINLPVNLSIREPNGLPWKAMDQGQLPPSKRLYLLSFQSTYTDPSVSGLSPAQVNVDLLATTYNVG